MEGVGKSDLSNIDTTKIEQADLSNKEGKAHGWWRPVLLLAVSFLGAKKSKECALITKGTRKLFSG